MFRPLALTNLYAMGGAAVLSVVHDFDQSIRTHVQLPPGVSVSFTGQYEILERANARLELMIPATLLIIFLLLYMEFRKVSESLLIMCCLPFSLVGGVWFMYLQGYAMSVASGMGFIALAGLAAEFGVVMLIYLRTPLRNGPVLQLRKQPQRRKLMRASMTARCCACGPRP